MSFKFFLIFNKSELLPKYLFQSRQWRRHHSAVVIDNNIILIGDLNQTGIGAATGEFVRSGTKPGTWSGEQFDLKNTGLWTCAVSYQGGFVTLGSATHRKVDRSKHITTNSMSQFLSLPGTTLKASSSTLYLTFYKQELSAPARHSHLQMEKRFLVKTWLISFYWRQQDGL